MEIFLSLLQVEDDQCPVQDVKIVLSDNVHDQADLRRKELFCFVLSCFFKTLVCKITGPGTASSKNDSLATMLNNYSES